MGWGSRNIYSRYGLPISRRIPKLTFQMVSPVADDFIDE